MTEGTLAVQADRSLYKPRFATLLLALSMFFTGASGLVAEYILATVSTYILGNSIEQMSITIATMMLMMGIGGWTQKFIVSDDLLIERFVVLEMVLAVLIGFAPIVIYGAFGLMETHFVLVQYFLIASIGFLIGFEIPLVLRINAYYSKLLRVNLASIFSMDYIGAFVGAIIWVHILLKRFPLTEISFLVAGANFLIAVSAFLYFVKHGAIVKKRLLGALVALTASLLVYGYVENRSWSTSLEQRLYDDPIILAETTRYQRLVMTHYNRLDEYRFYINGNLQFSSVDEAIYHEQLVHPVMSLVSDRSRVLVLGGGDGLALREILKYDDVSHVTLVDLDPDMVRVATEDPVLRGLNNDAFKDARVYTRHSSAVTSNGIRTILQETGVKDSLGVSQTQRIATVDVIHIDADKFLSATQGFWDVIIIDFPDPSSIELAKLYSKEFYLKLRGRLSENGMVVVQSTSPYHAKEAFLCILRTIGAAGFATIPYHDNVPSFGDWGWVLAWKSQTSVHAVRRRIQGIEFQVSTRYLDAQVFKGALGFGKGWLTSLHDDINTLMYPVLLQRYIDDSWHVD